MNELAQLNIARLVAPLDSPQLEDFVANLHRINTLAEASPGFVWRFETPAGDAIDADHPFGDGWIVNLSVWQSVVALHDYVYRSAHAPIMARRKEWFSHSREATTVLWWVPAGHRPTPFEAADRLARLQSDGPGAKAFTFKQVWPAPDPVTGLGDAGISIGRSSRR